MSKPKKDISEIADKNCKKCFGTGRLGFRTEKGERKPIPCQCVKDRVYRMAIEQSIKQHQASFNIGDKSVCQICGRKIEYVNDAGDKAWKHEPGLKLNHPAVPLGNVRIN